MTPPLTAEEIITLLELSPHPEGGYYRQTWVAEAPEGARPAGTCIYFLLKAGERSHWHRVDAAEIWLWHAGAPLVLSMAPDADGPRRDLMLGPDLASGARPQLVVPVHHWQAARSTGEWTLVSCTVSPGFRFDGFTLAEPGFDIS
ncbi:cupin domain-containing protein [Salipiger abyssi]|uniref:cupin domain-containing protein n=1 Tax=Salipiger abyssi TaxID=1250539 RepID=UPI001A90A74D|nr:cupin domain-containing protein [Salipiger abyssi]MBN9889074.1 cupin domain-containing protein [Salipiger abyssi]